MVFAINLFSLKFNVLRDCYELSNLCWHIYRWIINCFVRMINERLQRKSDKRILRIYFSFQVFLQWVMKLSSVCLWKESHSCLWIICLHTDPWIQHHRVEHRLHMDYTKTQNTETKSTEQLQKVPQDAWNKWPASFYFCLLHVVWSIFTFGRVFT